MPKAALGCKAVPIDVRERRLVETGRRVRIGRPIAPIGPSRQASGGPSTRVTQGGATGGAQPTILVLATPFKGVRARLGFSIAATPLGLEITRRPFDARQEVRIGDPKRLW